MPSNKIFFPSAEDFPREAPSNMGWNCLMFALGIIEPCRLQSDRFDLLRLFKDPDANDPAALQKAFLNKAEEFGFPSASFKLLEVGKNNIGLGQYIFRVYGFLPHPGRPIFGFTPTLYDFHVVRGHLSTSGELRWEHKPDWVEHPREVTNEDWEYFDNRYGNKVIELAFTPPSPHR